MRPWRLLPRSNPAAAATSGPTILTCPYFLLLKTCPFVACCLCHACSLARSILSSSYTVAAMQQGKRPETLVHASPHRNFGICCSCCCSHPATALRTHLRQFMAALLLRPGSPPPAPAGARNAARSAGAQPLSCCRRCCRCWPPEHTRSQTAAPLRQPQLLGTCALHEGMADAGRKVGRPGAACWRSALQSVYRHVQTAQKGMPLAPGNSLPPKSGQAPGRARYGPAAAAAAVRRAQATWRSAGLAGAHKLALCVCREATRRAPLAKREESSRQVARGA